MKKIPLKNYDNYLLCLEKMEILSSDSHGMSPIKFHVISKKAYFFLFKDGVKRKISFFEILRENKDEILKKISEFL